MRLNRRHRLGRRWRWLWSLVKTMVWGAAFLVAVLAAWPQLKALYTLNRVVGAVERAR